MPSNVKHDRTFDLEILRSVFTRDLTIATATRLHAPSSHLRILYEYTLKSGNSFVAW